MSNFEKAALKRLNDLGITDEQIQEFIRPKSERDKVIDEVLEIIDSEAWSYCDYIVKHENGNGDKQGAASHLADNIREAVSALKGGEQE